MSILKQVFRTPREFISKTVDAIDIKSPVAGALDFLLGENLHEKSPYYQHLDEIAESPTGSPDAAPILKLNSAILSQAVSDQASRIDLYTGLGDLDVHSVETLAHYEERIQWERDLSSADFARVMAEAGVKAGDPVKYPPSNKLSVIYTFGYLRLHAMTIPPILLGPCIRAYPFAFNHKRCSSAEKPENLLYIQTKTHAAYASIDHYDRQSDHKIGITLDYET